jgi:hypothetical protein
MIETLSKMSGTRHRTYTDSKTITKDMQAILKMTQNEGKASYTMTTKEEPVISYNDMAFISERNSIVFRAGDSPIWNRNETILPMSWRLFKTTITQPGKDYTLQTIPTLSTAMDFDVRKNQPNFSKMLEKRMSQAYIAGEAMKNYQEAYGYSDYEMSQLDMDNLSDEIMDLIYSELNPDEVKNVINNNVEGKKDDTTDEELEEMFDYMFSNQDTKNSNFTVEQDIYNEFDTIEDNPDQAAATANAAAKVKDAETLRYAGKMISRDMIISKMGVNHGLDEAIVRVYKDIRGRMEKDTEYFTVVNGNLCGIDGQVYIKNQTGTDHIETINEAAKDEHSRVFAKNDMSNADAKAIGSFVVTDAFLRFLITFPKAWPFADGEFESRMKREMEGVE